MSPLQISFTSFGFIFGGTLLGFYLSGRLPEAHLNTESKDAVKMTWGIVATMSALVLGLLVASAKTSFDTVNNERTETAAQIIILNHILERYGQESDGARYELRVLVQSGIKRDWPGETFDTSVKPAPANSNLIQKFHDDLFNLTPHNDTQRELLADALQITRELNFKRWLVIEQSSSGLPTVLYFAVIFWLTLLFLGLSLFAPHNRTTLVSSVLGAASVSVAIFIISDMSHPLQGLITVSSDSMRDVWTHLNENP